ncbi:hypothetical protein C0992_007325 [Termitomyces sp. T32_za158]|nr:hypothetical protein C0992_007325 [Termitomyces sp. T32_za158]
MSTSKKRLRSLFVGLKKVPPWPPDLSLKKALKRSKRRAGISSECTSDAMKTTLVALSQSADPFPLLKTACNSVLAIWEIAEVLPQALSMHTCRSNFMDLKRIKSCRRDAQDLAGRSCDILKLIAESVKDPSAMSPEIQDSIAKFDK